MRIRAGLFTGFLWGFWWDNAARTTGRLHLAPARERSPMPRRSAATALLRSPRSMYQVPCPMIVTSGPLTPNSFCITVASTSDDADQTRAAVVKQTRFPQFEVFRV